MKSATGRFTALIISACTLLLTTVVAGPATAQGVVPAPPSNFTATASGPHSIALEWTSNSPNASGFVVSINGKQSVDLVGGNITAYTWGGLQPGTRYCFYVASKIYGPSGDPTGYGNEQSAWVGPACATTTGAPVDGTRATVSVAPAAVRSYETFDVQGHLWIPGGTVQLSTPSGGTIEPSTLTVGADGSFRLGMTMNVPPGIWTIVLTEDFEGVTITRSVDLRVLPNPGRPAPGNPIIKVSTR